MAVNQAIIRVSTRSLSYVTALRIVEGRGNGIFDPNATITRQEAAKILYENLNHILRFHHFLRLYL
ncbi:MAG TPA: hypothetical protein DCZ10_18630 [Pelotomaculum sp.]|nr:hypothetical protein [Pelotomaculum sp.]